jgi:hypothetical protein
MTDRNFLSSIEIDFFGSKNSIRSIIFTVVFESIVAPKFIRFVDVYGGSADRRHHRNAEGLACRAMLQSRRLLALVASRPAGIHIFSQQLSQYLIGSKSDQLSIGRTRSWLRTTFSAVQDLPPRRHVEGGPVGILDGLQIAQALARNPDVLSALRAASKHVAAYPL